jgi:small conductance mechanosensitive channel
MNLNAAFTTIHGMMTGLIADLPRIVVGVIIICLSSVAARLVRWVVLRGARGRLGHENIRVALGRLAFVFTVAVISLIAATVVFPSFTIGGLIQLLGVSGVVVGFAFKDIFQNFLAGILILLTNPFAIDDQIAVDDFEGTVVQIQTRATIIRTYDHRQIVVPNADLFTKAVIVNTAYPSRRMHCDLTVKQEADIAAVKRTIAGALQTGIEGVEKDPVADVILLDLHGDAATLRLLWWSNPRRGESLLVQDRVLLAVHDALRAAQIPLA